MIYTDENRGLIQNRERARQIIAYDGLQFKRRITPTDIDGYFEYDDKVFVFYELKYGNAYPPKGQLLALKRIVKAITETGRKAVLFICSHSVGDPDKDIDAANATVTSLYMGGEMMRGDGRTAKRMTIDFLRYALGDEAEMVILEDDLQWKQE